MGTARQLSPIRFVVLFLVVSFASESAAQLDRLRKLKKDTEPPKPIDVPMVTVPAGEFWMGVDGMAGLEDERPRHKVTLAAFKIDRFEVTTAQYARFLSATKRNAPAFWEQVDLQVHGDRPVVGVDWFDAEAYCTWAGKRLPTEAEWEKAARGTDERQYPWGNNPPTPQLANFALGARFSYTQVLQPVGLYDRGKSPYGAHDMAGNVWEWVADWYDGGYYSKSAAENPPGPASGDFKVLRGGSWSELPKYLLTYGRFNLAPTTRNSFTGFRCAKS